VTAVDIAPMFWAEPGTRVPMRPQPGKTGPPTEALPAVSDTGELRAATDDYLEQMHRGEADWRQETGLIT
jgi:hypothetical protein